FFFPKLTGDFNLFKSGFFQKLLIRFNAIRSLDMIFFISRILFLMTILNKEYQIVLDCIFNIAGIATPQERCFFCYIMVLVTRKNVFHFMERMHIKQKSPFFS